MHPDQAQYTRSMSLWRIQAKEECNRPAHSGHPAWAEFILNAESARYN